MKRRRPDGAAAVTTRTRRKGIRACGSALLEQRLEALEIAVELRLDGLLDLPGGKAHHALRRRLADDLQVRAASGRLEGVRDRQRDRPFDGADGEPVRRV